MHVLIYTKGNSNKVEYIDFDDLIKFTNLNFKLKRQANNYLRFDNGIACNFEPDTSYNKLYAGSQVLCLQMTPHQAFLFISELCSSMEPKIITDHAFDLIASNFWSWMTDDEDEEIEEVTNEYKAFEKFTNEYQRAIIRSERK